MRVNPAFISALIALAVNITACSKQESPLTQTLSLPQPNASDLIAADTLTPLVDKMAADPIVQQMMSADLAFARDYERWFSQLSPAEKQARIQAVNNGFRIGDSLPDPVHSNAEIAAYRSRQLVLGQQIKAKYPQFNESSIGIPVLSVAEYRLIAQVLNAVSQSDKPCYPIHAYVFGSWHTWRTSGNPAQIHQQSDGMRALYYQMLTDSDNS